MASATTAGDLPADVGRVDVAASSRGAGVGFHEGVLTDLDLGQRVAVTADGTPFGHDVVSFDIGSVVALAG